MSPEVTYNITWCWCFCLRSKYLLISLLRHVLLLLLFYVKNVFSIRVYTVAEWIYSTMRNSRKGCVTSVSYTVTRFSQSCTLNGWNTFQIATYNTNQDVYKLVRLMTSLDDDNNNNEITKLPLLVCWSASWWNAWQWATEQPCRKMPTGQSWSSWSAC